MQLAMQVRRGSGHLQQDTNRMSFSRCPNSPPFSHGLGPWIKEHAVDHSISLEGPLRAGATGVTNARHRERPAGSTLRDGKQDTRQSGHPPPICPPCAFWRSPTSGVPDPRTADWYRSMACHVPVCASDTVSWAKFSCYKRFKLWK